MKYFLKRSKICHIEGYKMEYRVCYVKGLSILIHSVYDNIKEAKLAIVELNKKEKE